MNIQFGKRCSGLLLFIPVSGYDICGDRMLGRRCLCSGASMFIIEYICPAMMLLLNCFIRLRALWADMCDWKKAIFSEGSQDGGLAMVAMCGSRRWYRCRYYSEALFL